MEKVLVLCVRPRVSSGGPHRTHEGPPKPLRHNDWELLNIEIQKLQEIIKMLKGSDLQLCL